MSKRMVSAHAYPGESKEELLRAVRGERSHDVIVTDPLVLGTGAFDVQDLGDDLVLKVRDSTKREWMVFVERVDGRVVARED